mmetsp:Transcript_9768/g.24336  ORF Transcript_9768/g.24336 Transcript_9768/m.24336 type:complete len:369 (-) Transcript_9768:239-1345(-)|eukprot:CAMPEP_0202866042 /NCGR_PEP_ID=MMETSP1391-20130828/7098_1 /ASSEMBLY_ACC=CAM_ASM_000867 /TAXON_ID=1034604 /ORGANISM="Chlamydomonas leiostraca, Strain SAG 11-49" /LENGTH=368 /DNA_ID=CAMNT_0049545949 /DNA_START=22 /DNA_END=1128 /DNA_ORIENTATION=+
MLARTHRVASSRGLAVKAEAQGTSLATVAKPAYKNVGPDPKRFTVGEGQLLSIAGAALPALLRVGAGALCVGYKTSLKEDDGKYAVAKVMNRKFSEESDVGSFPRPAKPLVLYEFEGCPFCKKVREAVSMLDLDVEMRPTPRDGDVWRPEAVQRGGKAQFPYLVDPNTGKEMYESDDIIAYLFTTYGNGEVPRILRLGAATAITAGLGLAVRWGKGNKAVPSRQPPQPLVLWGYEASPFVKVVREVLCEMQLPYLYRNAARGSPKREELLQKYGHFQVPCLEDPNTESYLFESGAIIKYLQYQYAADSDAPLTSTSESAAAGTPPSSSAPAPAAPEPAAAPVAASAAAVTEVQVEVVGQDGSSSGSTA